MVVRNLNRRCSRLAVGVQSATFFARPGFDLGSAGWSVAGGLCTMAGRQFSAVAKQRRRHLVGAGTGAGDWLNLAAAASEPGPAIAHRMAKN